MELAFLLVYAPVKRQHNNFRNFFTGESDEIAASILVFFIRNFNCCVSSTLGLVACCFHWDRSIGPFVKRTSSAEKTSSRFLSGVSVGTGWHYLDG